MIVLGKALSAHFWAAFALIPDSSAEYLDFCARAIKTAVHILAQVFLQLKTTLTSSACRLLSCSIKFACGAPVRAVITAYICIGNGKPKVLVGQTVLTNTLAISQIEAIVAFAAGYLHSRVQDTV